MKPLGNGSHDWPKRPVYWIENMVLHISIPFTWDLPQVARRFQAKSALWDSALVGGPAVRLMPNYFNGLDFVRVGHTIEGVMQRVNPLATKTSIGCIRHCPFCAVPEIEGRLTEFDDWPDLPIICDNNLLACSKGHFDKVIDRLKVHGWADFNQGLDARRLTYYHAERIAEIKRPMVRLALDSFETADIWERSVETLSVAGVAKSNIRSYALIGFDSGPDEAWQRCWFVEGHGVKVLPMWFHALDAMKYNRVTEQQRALGWTDRERKRIMQWFYQHREYPRKKAVNGMELFA